MSYDNTNRGVLFRNNRKSKQTQPDYTGKLNVDGVDFELSAWEKEGKNGTFLSVSIKPPFKKEENAPSREEVRDEIPW